MKKLAIKTLVIFVGFLSNCFVLASYEMKNPAMRLSLGGTDAETGVTTVDIFYQKEEIPNPQSLPDHIKALEIELKTRLAGSSTAFVASTALGTYLYSREKRGFAIDVSTLLCGAAAFGSASMARLTYVEHLNPLVKARENKDGYELYILEFGNSNPARIIRRGIDGKELMSWQ